MRAACHPQIIQSRICFLESGMIGTKKSSNQVFFLVGETDANKLINKLTKSMGIETRHCDSEDIYEAFG